MDKNAGGGVKSLGNGDSVNHLVDQRAKRQNSKEKYEHFFGALVIGAFCLSVIFMFGVACTLVFLAAF